MTPKTAIVDAIHARRRFLHLLARAPDGDSIGSQLAMAYALRGARQGGRASSTPTRRRRRCMAFPGVPDIEIAAEVDAADRCDDALIIMECGDLERTGVAGSTRCFVINIDHHPGNTGYGADQLVRRSRRRRAARWCSTWSRALGVPLTIEIATHIYLAILTDTGSFHYSNISPRTFDICRAGARGGRRSGGGGAQRLRQQQHGPAEAVRRGAERDADRLDRPASRSSTSITRWRAPPAAPTRTPKG